jgi:hypothetical protein
MCRKKSCIKNGQHSNNNGNGKISKRPKDKLLKKPPGLKKQSSVNNCEDEGFAKNRIKTGGFLEGPTFP